MINELESDEKKKSKMINLLKNKEFISLVELMFFYLKFLK